MKALISILLVSLCSASLAQDATQQASWSKGSVILTDGTRLTGHIKYSDRDNYITYINNEEKKVFTSSNFIQTSFYDDVRGEQRSFVSLPYKVGPADQKEFVIFEILKEFPGFAVLSRSEPAPQGLLGATTSIIMSTPITRSSYETDTNQQEVIFLIDNDGIIRPYLQLVYRKHDTRISAAYADGRAKGKILNEKLLVEHVGSPLYQKLLAYAADNHLTFSRKLDFMKVLAYYESIYQY